jgi:hypothetical protein
MSFGSSGPASTDKLLSIVTNFTTGSVAELCFIPALVNSYPSALEFDLWYRGGRQSTWTNNVLFVEVGPRLRWFCSASRDGSAVHREMVLQMHREKGHQTGIGRSDGSRTVKGLASGGLKVYPNLSQYAANRAQTVQSEPNAVFSFHQLTSEPERNHPT